jgi:hypothetical protein
MSVNGIGQFMLHSSLYVHCTVHTHKHDIDGNAQYSGSLGSKQRKLKSTLTLLAYIIYHHQ